MKLRRRIAHPTRKTERIPEPAPERAPHSSPSATDLVGNQGFATAIAPAVAAEPAAPPAIAGLAEPTHWLSEETKPEFLALLRDEVHATAADALSGTGFTPANCPWIQYWFAYYAGRSAAQIEQAAARFAPETRAATDIAAIVPLIAARIRRGVEQWAVTGELTGVPGDIPLRIPGGPSPSGVFFAGHVSGVTPDIDPRLLRLRLGAGQPLPAPVRSRMESVFRLRFPNVRIHTGPTADALTRRLDARAFAVGQDIAFRSGAYQPGTPVGDAILAHELAHTAQQRHAVAPAPPSRAAEADAGRSTSGFLKRLWGGARSSLAAPMFQGGLSLQRCDEQKVEPTKKRVKDPRAPAPEPGVQTAPPKPSATAEGVAEVAETNPQWSFQLSMSGKGMRMNPAFWEVRYYVDGAPKPFVGTARRTALEQCGDYAQRVKRDITVPKIEVVLKPKVNPVDAVKDMLKPTQANLYSIECYAAQSLVQFAGVYQRMQKEIPNTADAQFNEHYKDFQAVIPIEGSPTLHFGGKDVKFGFNPKDPTRPAPEIKLKEVLDSSDDMGLLRGDWVYLSNREFITSGAFQGENATYLGGKKFYGHGLGVFTIEEYVIILKRDHGITLTREQILTKVKVGPRYRPPQDMAGFPPQAEP